MVAEPFVPNSHIINLPIMLVLHVNKAIAYSAPILAASDAIIPTTYMTRTALRTVP